MTQLIDSFGLSLIQLNVDFAKCVRLDFIHGTSVWRRMDVCESRRLHWTLLGD